MPRPKRDMIRVNTYLPTRHVELIKRLAKHDDATTADLLRQAVRDYLEARAVKERRRKHETKAELSPAEELQLKASLAQANLPT